jgi:hypothetical protein
VKQAVKFYTNFSIILLAKVALLLEYNIYHRHLSMGRTERLSYKSLVAVTVYGARRDFATNNQAQPD